MAIWIGNRSTSAKPIPKWAMGIICLLAIAFYIWAAFAVRSVSEDKRSHAVRISLPLLPGYGWMVYPGENFNPAKAEWGALNTGVGVADGQIVFVRTHHGDYALRLYDQSLVSEQAKYQFVLVGQNDSIHEGIADGERPVELPGRRIEWSGAKPGYGFLYLSENFVVGLKNPFQFGGPFPSGNVTQFQASVPPGIQFSSLAWKLNELNGVKFDEQGFLR